MNEQIEDAIADNKYVEFMYKVIDKKTGSILTEVEYPLGYVHGITEVLAPAVPEEYRQIGMSILMENDKGQTKMFIVTRVDKQSVTIDGNNPLCGREVIFRLEFKQVRDATEKEREFGGKVEDVPDVEGAVKVPL